MVHNELVNGFVEVEHFDVAGFEGLEVRPAFDGLAAGSREIINLFLRRLFMILLMITKIAMEIHMESIEKL